MKSLNALTIELKEELSYQMTSQTAVSKESYHRARSLKMTMRPDLDVSPHVIVTMMISEATFSLIDFEKLKGSLGPEEKYVVRWFHKSGVRENLIENWNVLTDTRSG